MHKRLVGRDRTGLMNHAGPSCTVFFLVIRRFFTVDRRFGNRRLHAVDIRHNERSYAEKLNQRAEPMTESSANFEYA